MRWIRGFHRLRKLYLNWPEVALFRFGLKTTVTLKLRAGFSIHINSSQDYESIVGNEAWNLALLNTYCGPTVITDEEITLAFKKRPIRLRHGLVPAYSNILREQFVEEQYRWLYVKNTDVLDVGGSIGDSAIYFALRGAKHVFVLEPYPYTFKLLSTNVKINNFHERITPIHAAACKDGTIKITEDFTNMLRSELTNHEGGVDVRTYSLASLIRENKLSDAVAKIDCEGGEYELLLGAEDRDLRVFRQYMVEYHQGLSGLPHKLHSAGFQVSYTGPIYTTDSGTGQSWEGGLIKAKRID